METNTVWVKLPLQCYACFNTCYYRFHLVRWAWKRAFGPPSEFITNSQFVLSTGVIWPPPKTYLARWQNALTLGYRTLKFPCTLQQRVDLSLSIMLKKICKKKSMQKKIIEYFQNCLKVSFCTWSFLRPCLRACYPSTELAKKAWKKKKKKKRLLGKLLLRGQEYR